MMVVVDEAVQGRVGRGNQPLHLPKFSSGRVCSPPQGGEGQCGVCFTVARAFYLRLALNSYCFSCYNIIFTILTLSSLSITEHTVGAQCVCPLDHTGGKAQVRGVGVPHEPL